MKNWGSSKIHYFSQLLRNASHSEARKRRRISKARFFATPSASLRMTKEVGQSLTELAVFGSLLLLALSFLVSYGMRYNYQQDAQMRAFRLAMQAAYNNNGPDAAGSVVLVEDKHTPDPRDRFGVGSFSPVQAGAEVTWGNTMQESYNVPVAIREPLATDLPRIKYSINAQNREYTTAGYLYARGPFYAEIPGQGRRSFTIAPNAANQMKIYNPTPTEDLPDHPGTFLPATQVMVIVNPNDPPEKREKEVISALAIHQDGPLMPIIQVRPVTGKDGDAVTELVLLDPELGQINPNYMQLNNDVNNDGIPDVIPANVQGLLPYDTVTNIKREAADNSLELKETPGKTGAYTSTSKFKVDTTIKHKIRRNLNPPNNTDVVTSTITRQVGGGGSKVWTTAK